MAAQDRVAYWQRRARDAERMLEYEVRHNASTRRWAQEAFAEQRRLTDRLCDVIRIAAEHDVPLDVFHQADG